MRSLVSQLGCALPEWHISAARTRPRELGYFWTAMSLSVPPMTLASQCLKLNLVFAVCALSWRGTLDARPQAWVPMYRHSGA